MQTNKPIHSKPSLYAFYFDVIKEIGMEYGYNIVLHGSMNRDLDLIAIAWQETIGDKMKMLNRIAEAIGGHILFQTDEDRKRFKDKFHGRESWVININRTIKAKYDGMVTEFIEHDDPQHYIDISIIPLQTEQTPKELKITASETTKQIQLAVGKMQVLKFHSPVCENVKYLINDFELDVMSVSKSGMLYEFEVKVSRSDFLADKKKRKHEFYKTYPNHQPNYFSYACPKDLITLNEIGSNCGLYYFDNGEITEVRPPKRIHKSIHDRNKVLEKICRITSERKFLNGCRMTYNNKK
jgi:hypothetical protein